MADKTKTTAKGKRMPLFVLALHRVGRCLCLPACASGARNCINANYLSVSGLKLVSLTLSF